MRKSLLLLLASLLCSGCYQTPEATVNGEEITRKDLESALRLAGGQRMLQKLITQRLIAQEAARAGIQLKPEVLKVPLETARNTTTDPELLPLLETEVRTRLLLRELVLRDVTEAKLREYYELFREDLARREVYSVRIRALPEALQASKELAKGAEFRLVTATHGAYKADRQRGGYRGPLTQNQIDAMFGSEIGDRILALKAGESTPPISQDGEYLLVQVADIQDEFKQLRPSLEELAGQAQMAPLMYRLLLSAKIDGPSIRDSRKMPQTTLYGREMLMPWELLGQPGPQAPVPPEALIDQGSPVNSTTPALPLQPTP